MTLIYVHTSTVERFQPDYAGRRLSLANAQSQRPAVSFDGGLVS